MKIEDPFKKYIPNGYSKLPFIFTLQFKDKHKNRVTLNVGVAFKKSGKIYSGDIRLERSPLTQESFLRIPILNFSEGEWNWAVDGFAKVLSGFLEIVTELCREAKAHVKENENEN